MYLSPVLAQSRRILCEEGEQTDGAAVEEVAQSMGARMHANRTWTFWRITTTAGIRYAWGGWWSIAQRGKDKRGTGYWRQQGAEAG